MFCVKCKNEINNEFLYCPHCGKKQQKTPAPKALKRANGTGSVYKLSGRRKCPWVAFFGGKILSYHEQRTDALFAIESAGISGVSDRYNATVDEMYKEWRAANYEALSQSGKNSMDYAWDRLACYKNLKMRDLRKSHLQEIINQISASGLSRSVCEKTRTLSSHICRIAMENEIIQKNYAQLLDLPANKKEEKEIFTSTEISKLRLYSGDDTARIILAMIYCGARPNELFFCDVSNFYFGEHNYFIGGSKTKAGKNRIIPLHDYIIPFVRQWIGERVQGPLLVNEAGNKKDLKNWRERNFYPLLKLVEITRDAKHKLTPYSCRHTFATNMMRNKTRPEILAKIIGHEDYDTTANNYGHVTDEDINEMCNAVNLLETC